MWTEVEDLVKRYETDPTVKDMETTQREAEKERNPPR